MSQKSEQFVYVGIGLAEAEDIPRWPSRVATTSRVHTTFAIHLCELASLASGDQRSALVVWNLSDDEKSANPETAIHTSIWGHYQ